jgi:uroporphyrinogen decarboxylase
MMTRREIVKRAITFGDPPRLPLKFDIVGVSDCHDVWTVDPTGWSLDLRQPQSTDEWGCTWGRTAVSNTGQVVGHPLANLADLRTYRWPDAADVRRYAGFGEQVAGAGDRFVMFCFGHGIWERLHMLMGMEHALVALVRHKEQVHETLDRILAHHLAVLHRVHELAGGRIDAAALADDWGTQDRAFISNRMFNEFFKPRYQRWFDEIKRLGMHVWMHSCGRINTILPELIDCGLEVINSQQPNTVGLVEFGAEFRGRVCFEAIVDTQTTLPRGTLAEIAQQARDICQHYGTPHGGLIASDYNDAPAIGVTTDRRYVMFEAFAEAGGYPDYREILARAQRGEIETAHAWGHRRED